MNERGHFQGSGFCERFEERFVKINKIYYLFLYVFRNIKNILIFNVTALRDYHTFLKILLIGNKIDLVLLCPIVTSNNNRRLGNTFDNYSIFHF